MFIKLFHLCRFVHSPDWTANVGYLWLFYWEPGTLWPPSASFAYIAFLFPFTALWLSSPLPDEPGRARWPQLWCQALMPAQLKAFQNFVMKHFDFPIKKYWVWALWMTLPESLNDRWVRSPDLNSIVWILWCLSYQTLSPVLYLMIRWFSHIWALIPVSWHCALCYSLLPRWQNSVSIKFGAAYEEGKSGFAWFVCVKVVTQVA